jgi:hypothetical protein
MKKLIFFILIATFTITIGCQSDKNGDTKMSADERQNAAGEQKVTRENWRPQKRLLQSPDGLVAKKSTTEQRLKQQI